MSFYSKLQIWIMACRPKTLLAAIAPIIVATAIATCDGGNHIPSAIISLLAAIFIQIATNLANDYYDFKSGADNDQRLGPQRVTQAGLLKPDSVKKGFIIAFFIAGLLGGYLALRGGWIVILVAALAILSGFFYTAKPWAYGYKGLGEVFVFIFFGPVAVSCAYYIQALEFDPMIILTGFGPGFLACAILAVNNLRDIESDRKAGKITLAVRFGLVFAQYEYLSLIFLAALMPIIIYLLTLDHPQILFCPIFLLLAIPTIRTVLTHTDGTALNQALGQTSLLLLIYSLLFSMGWVYADLRF